MQMPEVNEFVTRIRTDDEIHLELGGKLVKEVVKNKSRDEEIAKSVREARAYLESCMTTMRKEWFDWQDTADSSVKELRQFRMTLTSESKQIAEACKDVRGFLMSDAHTEEMRRLQEFVALCERLRDLKKDGTLGYVVDAILKIECK